MQPRVTIDVSAPEPRISLFWAYANLFLGICLLGFGLASIAKLSAFASISLAGGLGLLAASTILFSIAAFVFNNNNRAVEPPLSAPLSMSDSFSKSQLLTFVCKVDPQPHYSSHFSSSRFRHIKNKKPKTVSFFQEETINYFQPDGNLDEKEIEDEKIRSINRKHSV